MFKTVDSNGNFEVTNKALTQFDEIFEAIIYLLRVRSPFVEQDFSLDEFIGNVDVNTVEAELSPLLNHVYETILLNYEVINIETLSIKVEDDGFVAIEILVQTPDNIEVRTVYA